MPAKDPLLGRTFGQYTITAIIGRGGMATVYRARQESIGRDVAIKVIASALAENEQFVARFKREATTLGKLSAANIVKIFDSGQEGDRLYFVMEYLAGGSLADLIRKGPIPLERVTLLLTQIATALDYAHTNEVLHRDLKPQNILFDGQGNAILTDFGVARLLQVDPHGALTELTLPGVVMGTPAYIAPEQWEGEVITNRADIYALGIMLYEMLAGELPFKSDTPHGMMRMHMNVHPPAIRSKRAELPADIETVLLKALAKKPEDRYSTAGDLLTAFNKVIVGATVNAPTVSPSVQADTSARVEAPQPKPTLVFPDSANDSRTPDSATRRTEPLRRPMPYLAGCLVLVVFVSVAIFMVANQQGSRSVQNNTRPPSAVVQSAGTDGPLASATPMLPTLTQTVTTTSTQPPTRNVRQTFAMQQTAAALLSGRADPTATENYGATIDAALTAIASQTGQPTPTPTETPTPSITPSATPTPTDDPRRNPNLSKQTNSGWIPEERVINGVVMVVVPAGCFGMGGSQNADETNGGLQCFSEPFLIDKTEVTQAQFRRFGGSSVRGSFFKGDNRPVDRITWIEAQTYCKQRGARLPTETEWEYAARGPDALEFPWGNTFEKDRAVYYRDVSQGTADVGSIPAGASWVGALDLSGNVWELISTIYRPYPYSLVDGREDDSDVTSWRGIRGGSFIDFDGLFLRSAYRASRSPNGLLYNIGFRCASSID